MGETTLRVALVALNRPGYRSLGLGYVRAYSEAHERLRGRVGFQTLDLTTDEDPWWVAYRVLRTGADVVAFSVACWSARAIYEACSIMRAANPSLIIVLGGPEVSPIAEEVLGANPAVDMVVRGEGEITFAELLRTLLTGKRAWMCQGVTARDGASVVSAPDRPPIEDLDSLPSPYLTGLVTPSEGLTFLETYRGCPHRCGYCYEGKGIKRIRSFSAERIKAEIDFVASSQGVRSLSFIDSVFNLTPDRLSMLADMLEPHARRGLTLHTIEVDVERIDADQAKELHRAGVATVETGPQSIGREALAACHREFDAERFAGGVVQLKAAGIRAECDLIIGLPGDDAYDIIAGLRWLFDLDPGIVQSSTLHVLPGTDVHVDAADLGVQFQATAPHEVIQTRDIEFQDLRRLEAMAVCMQNSYRSRL